MTSTLCRSQVENTSQHVLALRLRTKCHDAQSLTFCAVQYSETTRLKTTMIWPMTKETARAKRAGRGGRREKGRGWTTPAQSSTAGARTVIKATQHGGGRIDTIEHSWWVWGARERPCCVRRSQQRPEAVAMDDDDAGDDDGGDCMRCGGAAPIGESTPSARSSFYARRLVTNSIYKI